MKSLMCRFEELVVDVDDDNDDDEIRMEIICG